MRLRQPDPVCALLGVLRVPAHAEGRDIGRDTLPANDGRAAEGAGTTGGAAADNAHVFTVTDRAGPVRALDGGSDTSKIIKVAGRIDANTDGEGDRLDRAANSGSERDLTADVGWTPTLHGPIDSAQKADRAVARGAGAGRIP
ncbi:hypothetical protein ACFZDB_35830 [Streptomyces luteogriseus]|uniref:hypothetical protein n=1 Tax=Streptomyces luteogriseus TaxID=68233 RepID=UPI0036E921BE